MLKKTHMFISMFNVIEFAVSALTFRMTPSDPIGWLDHVYWPGGFMTKEVTNK